MSSVFVRVARLTASGALFIGAAGCGRVISGGEVGDGDGTGGDLDSDVGGDPSGDGGSGGSGDGSSDDGSSDDGSSDDGSSDDGSGDDGAIWPDLGSDGGFTPEATTGEFFVLEKVAGAWEATNLLPPSLVVEKELIGVTVADADADGNVDLLFRDGRTLWGPLAQGGTLSAFQTINAHNAGYESGAAWKIMELDGTPGAEVVSGGSGVTVYDIIDRSPTIQSDALLISDASFVGRYGGVPGVANAYGGSPSIVEFLPVGPDLQLGNSQTLDITPSSLSDDGVTVRALGLSEKEGTLRALVTWPSDTDPTVPLAAIRYQNPNFSDARQSPVLTQADLGEPPIGEFFTLSDGWTRFVYLTRTKNGELQIGWFSHIDDSIGWKEQVPFTAFSVEPGACELRARTGDFDVDGKTDVLLQCGKFFGEKGLVWWGAEAGGLTPIGQAEYLQISDLLPAPPDGTNVSVFVTTGDVDFDGVDELVVERQVRP